jgi:tetraprenyl-beta-curcumene synthase
VQHSLRNVSGYEMLLPMFREAVQFYGEMQTFKHLAPDRRQTACIAWYERSAARKNISAHSDATTQTQSALTFRDIAWYEFACAAGSQFQVYVPLFLLFARGDKQVLERGYNAYFPAVAALHVLLDSFIDQAEDREHGELNFVDCYKSFDAMEMRVKFLAAAAHEAFGHLPVPYQHRFLLRVMALFYLTHPKIAAQNLDPQAIALLHCFEI